MRRLKLRQIVLLILRTLLVLVIILSLARPYRLKESPALLVRRGETLFLLIDNSASMQLNSNGTTLLNSAITNLGNWAEELEFPINLRLMTLCRSTRFQVNLSIQNREQLMTALNRVELTNEAAYPTEVLEAVFTAIVEEQLFSPRIWVISDYQSSNWEGIKDFLATSLSRLSTWHPRLIFLPVAAERVNIALNAVDLSEQIISIGEPLKLVCGLSNWHEEKETVPLNLFIEQERVGQNLVELKAQSSQEVSFEFLLLKSGELTGWVEIEDDLLSTDNRFYFVCPLPEVIRVLVVERNPGVGAYITKVFTAANQTRIAFKTVLSDQLFSENLSDYHLLVLVDIDALSEELTTRLSTYFQGGGKILLFLGDKSQEERYNRYWADRWEMPRWLATSRAESGGYLGLGAFRKTHPLFRDLWMQERAELDEGRFFIVPQVVVRSKHKPLLFLTNQVPLAVETDLGILMTTLPDPRWTDWQWRGSFPAVLLRMVQYLTSQSYHSYYTIGDTIRVTLPGATNATELIMTTPQGRRFSLEREEQYGRWSFRETFEPGFYILSSGAGVKRHFAVNLPLAETRAGFWSISDLEALCAINPRQLGVLPLAHKSRLNQMALGREYDHYFLFLALVLALGETFLGLPSRSKLE